MNLDVIVRTWQTLLEQTLLFIPKLIVALVIFFVALYVAGLLAKVTRRALQAREIDPELTVLLSRLARWTVVIIGTILALEQVDFDVSGFVAGLGIVGFTLGFAFQDIAKNFIAGVLLLVQQPFDLGDAIQVAGYGGTVTNIEVRATTLRTWDGLTVIVPNADVYTSAITNFSKATQRRLELTVGVGYESDLDRVRQTMTEALLAVPGVIADDAAPVIVFETFGDSAINVKAYFWIDVAGTGFFDAQSQALQNVKQAFEREGINIPYPMLTVLEPAGN